MMVGFRVGSIVDEIGPQALLHAFFSTISHHLEPDGWGSRFPTLLNRLYKGKLVASKAAAALAEVKVIQEELADFRPDQVIWDYEDPMLAPPKGMRASGKNAGLSRYFVTSTGRDLFGVLTECLTALQQEGGTMTIVRYGSPADLAGQ